MTKKKTTKPKTPPQESVFTKEDFLKALKKATRPVAPKASPVKGKRKTSA
jgi:hypothetical protein